MHTYVQIIIACWQEFITAPYKFSNDDNNIKAKRALLLEKYCYRQIFKFRCRDRKWKNVYWYMTAPKSMYNVHHTLHTKKVMGCSALGWDFQKMSKVHSILSWYNLSRRTQRSFLRLRQFMETKADSGGHGDTKMSTSQKRVVTFLCQTSSHEVKMWAPRWTGLIKC